MSKSEYYVGQVADLLSGGKKAHGGGQGLSALFSPKVTTAKILKEKNEKKRRSLDTLNSIPMKKKRVQAENVSIKSKSNRPSEISVKKNKINAQIKGKKKKNETAEGHDSTVKILKGIPKNVKHKEVVTDSLAVHIDNSAKGKKKKKKSLSSNVTTKPNNSEEELMKVKHKKSKQTVPKEDTTPVKVKTEKDKSSKKIKKKTKACDADSKVLPKIDGFCPPAGIVHVSLLEKSKENNRKNSKKRKLEADSSEDDNDDDNDDDEDGEKAEKSSTRRKYKRDKTKDRRTVFVGNLPLDAKKSTVKNLFREFGEIESLRFRCPPPADLKTPKRVAVIKKEFHPERSNIVSFVCFKEQVAAKKSLKLNGHDLNGFHLRVDLASNNKKHNKTNSVFIGNIAYDTEENAVWDHFEPCGNVENVRIVRDRKTGLGKGFCYVLFQEKSSVDLALKLNDSKLKGRKIRVTTCSDKPKKIDHKNHPARQRLLKKARKMGIKPTNFRPGQKLTQKGFKKDKSKKKVPNLVDKAFSASTSFKPRSSTTSTSFKPGPSFSSKPKGFSSSFGRTNQNKHIKFN